MSKIIIPVKMDNVIANLSKGFLFKYVKRFGATNRTIVPMQERKQPDIKDDYHVKYHKDIDEILDTAGFYLELEPIEKAVEVIDLLREQRCDIMVVTSVRKNNPTCYNDKKKWLSRYFGNSIAEKMIVTSDITMIFGDILISDNPNPKRGGLNYNPSWSHIFFDQPWNRDVKGPRIANDWSNADDVIKKVLRKREIANILKSRGLGDYDEDIVGKILGRI